MNNQYKPVDTHKLYLEKKNINETVNKPPSSLLSKTSKSIEINLYEVLQIIITIIRFIKSVFSELWVTPSLRSIIINMLMVAVIAKITVALSYAIGVSPIILIIAKEYLKIFTDVYGQLYQLIHNVINYYKEYNITTTENIILKSKIDQMLSLLAENTQDNKKLKDEITELRGRIAQTELINESLSNSNARIIEQLHNEKIVTTQDTVIKWASSIATLGSVVVYSINIFKHGWNIFSEVPSSEILRSVKDIIILLRSLQNKDIRETAEARERGEEPNITDRIIEIDEISEIFDDRLTIEEVQYILAIFNL